MQQQPAQGPGAAIAGAGDSYSWKLSAGSRSRTALDALMSELLLQHQLLVVPSVHHLYTRPLAQALTYVLEQLQATVEAAEAEASLPEGQQLPADQASQRSAAWVKLFHLLPSLLLSPGPSVSRKERFRLFAVGELADLIGKSLSWANKRAIVARKQRDWAALRAGIGVVARGPGGLGRAARQLADRPNTSSPRHSVL